MESLDSPGTLIAQNHLSLLELQMNCRNGGASQGASNSNRLLLFIEHTP